MRRAWLAIAAGLSLTAAALAQTDSGFDPGKPKELTATPEGPYAVLLDWKNVRGAEYYEVYRDGNLVGQPNQSEYRDEGLTPATTYVYRVRAVDDDGDAGDFSDPVQVTTEELPGPTTPADLVASAAAPTRIDLTWSPSESDSGIDFYRVHRDGLEISTTPANSYEDDGLTPETTYEYRVSAVDGAGKESDLSDPASATTPAFPPPPPPENVTAMPASSSRIDLTWNPPAASDTEITGYRVYRGSELIGFVTGTAFADTGLSPETTYSYGISSVDTRGIEGPTSEEVSVTTDAAQDVIPPAPPTGLRLSGT